MLLLLKLRKAVCWLACALWLWVEWLDEVGPCGSASLLRWCRCVAAAEQRSGEPGLPWLRLSPELRHM